MGSGETAGTAVGREGGTGGTGRGHAPGPGPGPGARGGGAGAESERTGVRGGGGRGTAVPGERDTEQSPRPVKMTGRTMLLTTPS